MIRQQAAIDGRALVSYSDWQLLVKNAWPSKGPIGADMLLCSNNTLRCSDLLWGIVGEFMGIPEEIWLYNFDGDALPSLVFLWRQGDAFLEFMLTPAANYRSPPECICWVTLSCVDFLSGFSLCFNFQRDKEEVNGMFRKWCGVLFRKKGGDI